MLVTLLGIVIFVKELQPENAPALIVVNVDFSSNTIEDNILHEEKALLEMNNVFLFIIQSAIEISFDFIKTKYGFSSLPKYRQLPYS